MFFPRGAAAVFLIAIIAVIAAQFGASGWAVFAMVLCGMGAMAVLSLFSDAKPVHAPPATMSAEQIEANVIQTIAEPVLLLVDNRVRAANDAALSLLGRHIVGEDVRLAIRHPSATARLAADATDGSVELLDVAGGDNRMEMHVATISPGKRVVHLIDRAARHLVEQARTDFVANASHELRTPLSAILGFVETLTDDKAGGDAELRGRFLTVVLKEARRMQRLVDDLISLSRIEADKYLRPDDQVSMASLLQEVAYELRDQQGDEPTPLVLDLGSSDDTLAGDRVQLSQLVHNLVGNAIKYGRPGAPVRIGLKRQAGSLQLSVADQGEGIASEHIPRLTERFYRVDAGRSRSMGGTGLGLAIVKHIVERHRGRLEIDSIVGRGTVVRVTFPLSRASDVTET